MNTLFEEAQRACASGASTADFEPQFVRLLEFIVRHPGCQGGAEQRFLEGLSGSAMCSELVAFCVHYLRVQSVKDKAMSLVGNPPDPRLVGDVSHVVTSFGDDWDCADLYEYYRERKGV